MRRANLIFFAAQILVAQERLLQEVLKQSRERLESLKSENKLVAGTLSLQPRFVASIIKK